MSIDSYEASRKRSDEIRADLPEHPEKYTMLTGDRPTGRLHLGHYFGTIRERVALQDLGITTRIIIADYQVITDRDTTANIADNVRNMVVDYLACGIDPAKTHIFIQSMVPQLTELTFYYMNLVTVSRVQRNPTVKAEIQMRNFEASIPVGFSAIRSVRQRTSPHSTLRLFRSARTRSRCSSSAAKSCTSSTRFTAKR